MHEFLKLVRSSKFGRFLLAKKKEINSNISRDLDVDTFLEGRVLVRSTITTFVEVMKPYPLQRFHSLLLSLNS
ncbi:hypothetical protein RchiOBHm_Chr7g0207731 [Rosa chinensis]|uniref:Uncharacterized protein n=1 Tax=Rosa chinensis TaxID=74649 RepID=A0A2P6P9I7_ROSCH|nr:hypothetical protein RchiOBHm_Chr7g0207731 [Rosa chinensis]